jgi:hypothetical protein
VPREDDARAHLFPLDTSTPLPSPMAKQPNLTNYQRKIVDRYYQHQDTIYATKLAELVGSIALAETDKQRDTLWKRAREYLTKCKASDAAIAAICDSRNTQRLAQAAAALNAGKPVPPFS